ncbi:hypothetical protein vseg_016909 [Gypsophila vaccaria]
MEINHIAVSFMYMAYFVVVGHVSCIPSKYIFPEVIPSIIYDDALSPISQTQSSIISPESSPTASSSSSSSTPISPTSPSLLPADSPRPSITSLIDDLTTKIPLKVPKKVVEACKKTDHPGECSASVAPLLDGNYEPVAVLQGESKAFERALEVASEDISNIWGVVGGDEQSMTTCKQMYENAREEIAKAMELSTKNDKYGVNIHMSAALSFIATCKDEIPQGMKDDSTIVATNNLLSNLASNCLALGDFAMGADDPDY